MTAGEIPAEIGSVPPAGYPPPVSPQPPPGKAVAARAPGPLRRLLGRLDGFAEPASDLFNPLLVKEARQSLKSLHFVVTFLLMLLITWGFSVITLAFTYPTVHLMPIGPVLLSGYHWILAFPMLVLVPFVTYRSLAAEREDGTYDLLSITTLRPRQIVLGKFGCATLQMMIYLAAVLPCVAFTYLVRGVDLLTLAAVPLLTMLGSLVLSALGLMLGAVSKKGFVQLGVTVVFLVALLFAFWFAALWVQVFVIARDPFPTSLLHAIVLVATIAAAYALLFLSMATGYLGSPGENRASPARVGMFVVAAVLAGWMVFHGGLDRRDGLLAWMAIATIHWTVLGAMMNGESTEVSARVRRQLPKSLLTRLLLTWFYPGSGSGYLFAVGGLATLAIMALAVIALENLAAYDSLQWSIVYMLCYLTAYLGAGRLILLLIGLVGRPSVPLSLLLTVVLLIAGCMGPLLVQAAIDPYNSTFNPLHFTNPFYTISATLIGGVGLSDKIGSVPVVPLLVTGSAGLIFLANLFTMRGVIRRERIATAGEESRVF